jgi:fructose-1,6-bisphosphatase
MNFLRRMVDRAVERYMGHKQYTEDLMRAADTFDKTTVQRIANGYVVYGSNTVMYCADHIAIADFIVAQATRNKMGVGTQMDLFENVSKAGQVLTKNTPNFL